MKCLCCPRWKRRTCDILTISTWVLVPYSIAWVSSTFNRWKTHNFSECFSTLCNQLHFEYLWYPLYHFTWTLSQKRGKNHKNTPSFCLTCSTEKGEKTMISIFRRHIPHRRPRQFTVKHKNLCNTKGNNKRWFPGHQPLTVIVAAAIQNPVYSGCLTFNHCNNDVWLWKHWISLSSIVTFSTGICDRNECCQRKWGVKMLGQSLTDIHSVRKSHKQTNNVMTSVH